MIRARAVRCFLLLSCLAVAPLGGTAGAQPIEEARAAYAEGRFADAVRIGAALGTSEGYALAAGSLAIQGYYFALDDEAEALLEEATALAQKAIRADPSNTDAYLRLVQAMGRHAQAIGSFEAINRGYAGKIREAAEKALELDPESAPAHAALGTWHVEVVAAAGSFIARITHGARESDAIAHFEAALKHAPDMKFVNLECALGLLILDEDEYRARARELLARAVELPAKDAYDRLLHKRAVERLRALDASGG